ncbi:protein YgfX [Legionella brunensis]|uniref:protein YgfX n=1 Tax=Legionella brunensis TaxID=29422 RepID=UPI003B75CCB5
MSSSNYTISFGKSFNFLRVATLIYSSAFLLLFHSTWQVWLKLLLTIPLVFQLIRIFYNPIPYAKYLKLTYHNKEWQLYERNASTPLHYEKVRIVINTGLFFLLELRKANKRKVFVIFADQISNSTFRDLKIHENFDQN